MRVALESINNRQFYLNMPQTGYIKNVSNIRLLDESNDFLFENNVLTKIHNWQGSAGNIDEAYNRALDALDLLIAYSNNKSTIMQECKFLLTEANKVRNASQLKRSIKYRLGRIKSKIYGKIKKLQKALHFNTGFRHENSIGEHPYIKDEDRLEIADECYKMLEETLSTICESDRIVNQYSKIHNRFNIDRVISECAEGKKDIYETVYNIASYIDTFQQPFKNKFNATLETAWYGLNKKYIQCENSEIIQAVTDYYIFNGGISESNKLDIDSISKISPVFEDYDFGILAYMDDVIPDETISKDDYDMFWESQLDKLAGIEKNTFEDNTKKPDLNEVINNFRKTCSLNADSSTNIASLHALAMKFIESYPEHIPEHFSSLVQIIRTSFILYDSIEHAHDSMSVISNLVKYALEAIKDERQVNMLLKVIDRENSYIKAKQENKDNLDQDTKERLDSYSKCLKTNMDLINDFKEANFGDEDADSTDEDMIKEAANIIMIGNLLESICSNMLESTTIDDIITNNIPKYNLDTIDALVDFANTAPDVINKDKFTEALIEHRDSLRVSRGINISESIRIDALNENIAKLSEARSYPIYNDPSGIIAYLLCIDELKHINNEDKSLYFTEAMSFTNTLKLAINNLRRTAINLSEKEKAVANSIDGLMNSITRGMDRQMSAERREQIARGSILPSASKCIKYALVFAAAWVVRPELAIIGAIGAFFCNMHATYRERQIALDEIEVELKMCERYIRMYEEKQDLPKVRQCEIIYRNLQRQHQRIKYRMKIDFKHADTSKVSPINGTSNN